MGWFQNVIDWFKPKQDDWASQQVQVPENVGYYSPPPAPSGLHIAGNQPQNPVQNYAQQTGQRTTVQPPPGYTSGGSNNSGQSSGQNYQVSPQGINYSPVQYDLGQSRLDEVTKLIEQNRQAIPAYKLYTNLTPESWRQGFGNAIEGLGNAIPGLGEGNFSELIAGGATRGTAAYARGLGVPEASDVARNSSFIEDQGNLNNWEYPEIQGSGYGNEWANNLSKAKTDYQNLVDDPYKGNYGQENADSLNQDLYALADDINQQGFGSQQQAQESYAEQRVNRILQDWEKLKSDATALIPEYQKFEKRGIRDYEEGLADLQASGAEKKENVEETYGQTIRRGTKNKQFQDAQRRNMFSGLGTADSSAFIEAQTGADKEFLTGQGKTEREMSSKMSGIDKELMGAERETKADTRDKIINIQRNINLSEGDKRARIDEVYSELAVNVSGLISDYNTKQAALLESKMNMSNSMGLIQEQGRIDQGLLAGQHALENNYGKMIAGNMPGNMPGSLEMEIRGFFNSSTADPNAWASSLKSKYPQWSDLIDGVVSGTINQNSFQA